MKKILFICPRNPFSERYSGDVIRAKKFIYSLSKNNYVKVISSDFKDSKKKESKLSYEGFKEINFFIKIFYIFFSLIKIKPLQLGYFFSPKILLNSTKYILHLCELYFIMIIISQNIHLICE